MLTRILNHPITITSGLIGFGASCIYYYNPFTNWINKQLNTKLSEKSYIDKIIDNNKILYKIDIHNNYEKNVHRCYEYKIKELTKNEFSIISNQYQMDLMGYYKVKEHIDKMLFDYLQNHYEIKQKHLILSTKGWNAHILIENNTDDRYLVLNCFNNSEEEIKYDAIQSEINKDIKLLSVLK